AALPATGQCASHDGALSRWPVGSSGALPAISFSAAEVVGKHGRAPHRFPGWANAGERWPVVPDGAGAQTLSVARGIAFRDDRVRNSAFDGVGADDGLHPVALFSWREPGVAFRQEHGHGRITGRCETLGGDGVSVGRLPPVRGFDGSDAVVTSAAWHSLDG